MNDRHFRDECFKEKGFDNIFVKRTGNELHYRTNVRDEEAFKKWKELYCLASKSSLNVVRTRSSSSEERFRYNYMQNLMCQFGCKRHKGVKRHYTGCTFQMKVTIRRITHHKRRKDKLLELYPCFIRVVGAHNHADQPERLQELQLLPGVREDFEEYFKRGLGIAAAQRYHQLKMDLSEEFWSEQARADTNPAIRSITYMFEKWLKNGGARYNKDNMFDAIDKFVCKSKSVIEVERSGRDSFCVALVTPFMRRVHKLREASEVVLVDVVTSDVQPSTAIVPFHCSSPAGVLPLGIVFCSPPDEAQLTTGFRLLQKALGDSVFGGRGHPVAFVTENCSMKKNALRAVWPKTAQFRSVSHVLQETWKWLQGNTQDRSKQQLDELMTLVRMMANAESPEYFQVMLDDLSENQDDFARYLADLAKSRAEWAMAFRHGCLRRSHHSNNHAAAALCIMKDIAKNRCRTRTACELVIVMDDVYSGFMVHRLIDFALDLRQSKRLAPSTIPENSINREDEHNFRVKSDADPPVTYDVSLDLGVCSCEQGKSGGACMHQAACAHMAMVTLPGTFLRTPENRHWLMCVAVGEDKAPELSFFSDFRANASLRAPQAVPHSAGTDASASLATPADPDSPEPPSPSDDENDEGADEPSSPSHPAEEAARPASEINLSIEAVESLLQPSNQADEASRTVAQLTPPETRRWPSSQVVARFHEALDHSLELLGDDMTEEALQKATYLVKSMTSSVQLHSWLTSPGPSAESVSRDAAERDKVCSQTTTVAQRPEEQTEGSLQPGVILYQLLLEPAAKRLRQAD